MSAFKKAQKIWIKTNEQLNVYADFAASFTAKQGTTELVITADTCYIVAVNGKALNGTQFADFVEYKVYDRYDITPFVKEGENDLLITCYSQGEGSFMYKKSEAGVMFELTQNGEVLAFSSEDTRCRINPNYKSGEIERFTMQESFSFRYDANAEGGEYEKAIIQKGYDKVFPRPIKQLSVGERTPAKIAAQGVFYKPSDSVLPVGEYMKRTAFVSLSETEMGFSMTNRLLPKAEGITLKSETGDGIFFLIDLKKELSGFLDFEIELPCDAEVHIGFGEHINSLRVSTELEGRQFAAVYKAKKGRNKFTHRFKRIAGRYLQFHIPADTVTVYYAGLLPTDYPLTEKPNPVFWDKLHSKIYEVSKHTLGLCMHEHYEDCPWREQALYAMDSRIEMLCTYHAFEDSDFARASLKLFSHSQRENGQIELCAPADSPIYIPSFTLCYVIECAEYLKYTGDVEFLREVYPVLKKLIDAFCQKLTKNGLISPFLEPEAWNFYEWAPGLDGREAWAWPDTSAELVNEREGEVFAAPLNAYLSLALGSYSYILAKLGKNEEAEKADKLRAGINTALDTLFWNEEKGAYSSFIANGEQKHYGELTQALFMMAGAVREENLPKVAALLKEENDLVPITLGSIIHKYEALINYSAENKQFVADDVATRWGDMLFSGATSFWETFTGADEATFGGATSLCHGWAALPIYLYNKYLSEECFC